MFKCVWDRQSGGAARAASPLQQRRACSRSLELVQRMELSAVLEGHQGCVNTVAFDPEGRLLVSGSDDQRILVWDWMAGDAAACVRESVLVRRGRSIGLCAPCLRVLLRAAGITHTSSSQTIDTPPPPRRKTKTRRSSAQLGLGPPQQRVPGALPARH